jgi:hypothetical protein
VHLTDADIGFFDSNARMTPPFRSQRDRDAIRLGLLDGTIDALCSDHTPVDDDEKLLPFAEASPGATGLELLLSLTLKWAEDYAANRTRGARPLSRALARITSEAARVAGLAAGTLSVGAVADVVLFDAGAHWTVERSRWPARASTRRSSAITGGPGANHHRGRPRCLPTLIRLHETVDDIPPCAGAFARVSGWRSAPPCSRGSGWRNATPHPPLVHQAAQPVQCDGGARGR